MGPGGIQPGLYIPQNLTQEQRQWLWQYFGHTGTAPVGYGGEGGQSAAQSIAQYPTFQFNIAAEQTKAYEALKPFYEKLLSFAQGDVDFAKRILEYTYQTGMRESGQEHELRTRELANVLPQETEQLQTAQNRRGVLTSGFGGTERQRLVESQNLRQEALQRAKESREEKLRSTREFRTEEQQKGLEKTKFEQERERRQEALGMAQTQAGIESSKYQSQLGQFQFSEQKRAEEEANRYKQWMAGQGAYV